MLGRLLDNRRQNSLVVYLRRKRFAFLSDHLATLSGDVSILDVGGIEAFWDCLGYGHDARLHITTLNIDPLPVAKANFYSAVGDGCCMEMYKDKEYDIVFSNSCIEHVGTFEKQQCMADEIRRVGVSYIVQTPNKYFPIEPHFLMPFFQLLPLSCRAALHARASMGWMKRAPSYTMAKAACRDIRLLDEREFRGLFPDAIIIKEYFCGLVKSFIAFRGGRRHEGG